MSCRYRYRRAGEQPWQDRRIQFSQRGSQTVTNSHPMQLAALEVTAAKSTDYLVTALLERSGYGGLTQPLTCIFVVFTAVTTGTPSTYATVTQVTRPQSPAP
jgi:purine-cytosine permease-like protein